MSRYANFYPPYTPVSVRKDKAAKKIAAMKRKGQAVAPVVAATPRGKIALSFWGQAWCRHLESYSDFSNRLPRGRSYLRNGSVLHLGVETGRIEAMVMGTSCYKQVIRIDPLPAGRWKDIKRRCQGKIGSIVELLQGKLSDEVMAVVTDPKHGLFPEPDAIHLDCSCPDWAELCKHLAAILYGLGTRLDTAPELLFKLRGVDHEELIVADPGHLAAATGRRRRTLDPASLGDVFGIEIEELKPPKPTVRKSASPSSNQRPAKPLPRKAAAKKVPRKVPRKTTPGRAAGVAVDPDESPDDEFIPMGLTVQLLRLELNLSTSELASRLGVSPATVSRWESSTGRLNLKHRSLQALAQLYRDSQA